MSLLLTDVTSSNDDLDKAFLQIDEEDSDTLRG